MSEVNKKAGPLLGNPQLHLIAACCLSSTSVEGRMLRFQTVVVFLYVKLSLVFPVSKVYFPVILSCLLVFSLTSATFLSFPPPISPGSPTV